MPYTKTSVGFSTVEPPEPPELVLVVFSEIGVVLVVFGSGGSRPAGRFFLILESSCLSEIESRECFLSIFEQHFRWFLCTTFLFESKFQRNSHYKTIGTDFKP